MLKIKLRPHQEAVLNQLRLTWKQHRTHLVSANVGFGKTALSAAIVGGFYSRGLRVLFIAPYTTLVNQTAARFMEYGLPQPGIIWQNHEWTDPANKIQIASADTLTRREFPDVDLVISDECFTGDTLISTTVGPVKIKNVTRDHLIYCFDEGTGRVSVDKPVRVFENGLKRITHVNTTKGIIRCTSTHQFYSNGSWVQAKDLIPQQTLRFRSSRDSVIKKLQRASAAVAKKLFQTVRQGRVRS